MVDCMPLYADFGWPTVCVHVARRHVTNLPGGSTIQLPSDESFTETFVPWKAMLVFPDGQVRDLDTNVEPCQAMSTTGKPDSSILPE